MIKPNEVKDLAVQKAEENMKFRSFLKENADAKELDRQFLRLHNVIFTKYDCSKCRNCCKEYEISIPKRDLEKDAKKMSITKDEFVNLYLDYDKAREEYIVNGKPCRFLESDGTCLLGDCRPRNCKEYPFTNKADRLGSLYSILDSVEVCPAVFEIYEHLKEEYGFAGKGEASEASKKSILKSVDDFLDVFPPISESAAAIEYMLYCLDQTNEDFLDNFLTELNIAESEKNKISKEMITQANTQDDFFKLMRKPLSVSNKEKLINRLLDNEDDLFEFIKEKSIRNVQDHFIETALQFFLRCKRNPCSWICENYNDFRSEYMKSMLCMVLGIRGDFEHIVFLKEEALRFMSSYPKEKYEQGPLHGLHCLQERLK